MVYKKLEDRIIQKNTSLFKFFQCYPKLDDIFRALYEFVTFQTVQ